jgi:hypothetical protein
MSRGAGSVRGPERSLERPCSGPETPTSGPTWCLNCVSSRGDPSNSSLLSPLGGVSVNESVNSALRDMPRAFSSDGINDPDLAPRGGVGF